MSNEARTLHIDQETAKETPLVDLAYEILHQTNQPFYYRDLMAEVAQLRGMETEEINEVIARLYTEINVDGRFLNIGNNVWGLKRWYPLDKTVDKSGGKQFIRKDVDWEDDEEEELYGEDEILEEDEFEDSGEEEDLDFHDEEDIDDEFTEEEADDIDSEVLEDEEDEY